MAKAKKRGGKRSKTGNSLVDRFVRPTEARAAHNDFRSMGPAVCVVPVIVRLREENILNTEEFEKLAYYRDQASLADKSPVRSCCDFSVRGGSGPGVAIMSAELETWRMEREMGALWSLARAVAVDDVTLEQWCITRHGSQDCDGLKAKSDDVMIAVLELKYAAGSFFVGRC